MKVNVLPGRAAFGGVFLLIATGPAAAQGDMELGRYLASECMTCHRGAAAGSTIPNIFGRGEGQLADLIRAYRDKKLPNPVMQNVAGRLNDEEIASLALYFSKTRTP